MEVASWAQLTRDNPYIAEITNPNEAAVAATPAITEPNGSCITRAVRSERESAVEGIEDCGR